MFEYDFFDGDHFITFDIIDIDEAIGSRIHEKTKGYRNVILKDEGRNWRLREEK